MFLRVTLPSSTGSSLPSSTCTKLRTSVTFSASLETREAGREEGRGQEREVEGGRVREKRRKRRRERLVLGVADNLFTGKQQHYTSMYILTAQFRCKKFTRLLLANKVSAAGRHNLSTYQWVSL